MLPLLDGHNVHGPDQRVLVPLVVPIVELLLQRGGPAEGGDQAHLALFVPNKYKVEIDRSFGIFMKKLILFYKFVNETKSKTAYKMIIMTSFEAAISATDR